MYYQLTPLRFECTQCGKCCTGNQNHYIAVSDDEVTAIYRQLGISKKWFLKRYMQRQHDIYQGIKLEKNGRCPFLLTGGLCKIYDVRPTQCKTYPYWPELVNSKSAWLAESKRCEGINRGKKVTKSHIRKMLQIQTAAEADSD